MQESSGSIDIKEERKVIPDKNVVVNDTCSFEKIVTFSFKIIIRLSAFLDKISILRLVLFSKSSQQLVRYHGHFCQNCDG